MKRWRVGIVLFVVFLLAGCNQNNHEASSEHDHDNENGIAEIVEVTLKVPENEKVDQSVLLKAHVTQGEEVVDDADEVVFEIWKDGEEDSVMIDSTNKNNGTYEAEEIFDETGLYEVQVHVTARRMHIMPKTKIEITE